LELSAELLETIPPGYSPITWFLESLLPEERASFMAGLSGLECSILEHDWDLWARPEQREPVKFASGEKHTWLILGGRGMGKTRPGAETTIKRAELLGKHYRDAKIALIAKDPSDARKVMLEGVSGILTVSPPWFRPSWEPSKTQLTWPNGVIANIFSSEDPDDLRGPQHHFGWWDEPAKAKKPEETWDMYRFGLRLGDEPQTVITGTPRPILTLKQIIADPDTIVTRGKTRDNLANLSATFIDYIHRKYQGTRLGRQELDAEMLEDTPGALWTLAGIDRFRVKRAPSFVKLVVAVDPNVSDVRDVEDESIAECGIVAVGLGEDGHGYVIHDFSDRLSPGEWGEKVVRQYTMLKADDIIAEVNNGGALVGINVQSSAKNLGMPMPSYEEVRASRGKRTRAEPVSALYEQGRVHHVGIFSDLEDQMVTWIPGAGLLSPDRMDALVWGITYLMLNPETRGEMEGRVSW
jgi:phage terminase large subunit-like protein